MEARRISIVLALGFSLACYSHPVRDASEYGNRVAVDFFSAGSVEKLGLVFHFFTQTTSRSFHYFYPRYNEFVFILAKFYDADGNDITDSITLGSSSSEY